MPGLFTGIKQRARLSAVRVVAGDVVINVSRWVQHRKKEPVRPRGRTM